MSRNWERYDSENAEEIEARLVHLNIYNFLKTEHHLTAQDYSNGLHYTNLEYNVGIVKNHYEEC
jgi:hypothetical protein